MNTHYLIDKSNITKLVEKSSTDFNRYSGIFKANSNQMLEVQEHEAFKTKSGRTGNLSLEAQILLNLL